MSSMIIFIFIQTYGKHVLLSLGGQYFIFIKSEGFLKVLRSNYSNNETQLTKKVKNKK